MRDTVMKGWKGRQLGKGGLHFLMSPEINGSGCW